MYEYSLKNKYGIDKIELTKIFQRDKKCVYCRSEMSSHNKNYDRKKWYSIEHLNIIPPWNNHNTVVACCWSCNSSRGNKLHLDWFKTNYCITKNINLKTVSIEVNKYISHV